mgnify:CR=1 FL=1
MGVTFNSGTFLVMMVNFIILMYVLVKLLYRPIQGILEERRQKIAQTYTEAEKAKEKAEQLREEARKKLEESHTEAFEIIERARSEAELLRDELITQARREADEIRRRSRKEIERAQQIAKSELKEEAVELAMISVKKVFEKNKTSQLNDALIRGVLEEINKGAFDNDLPGSS